MTTLTVDVPATLSNLGPGYDTLGLALDLRNRFHFSVAPGWSAEGQAVDPDSHLALRTAREAAARWGGVLPGLHVTQTERVPRARGLGSSATARVAGLIAALQLGGAQADPTEQLAFLAQGEGHPDNVAPALLGGLAVVALDGEAVMHRTWPAPALEVALAVPRLEVSTAAARKILPTQVPHDDAVFNLGRLAFLLTGLLRGDAKALRYGLHDRLHQRWRAELIGPVEQAFDAALAAGALGAFVSGSGSTLAAFVPEGGPTLQVAEALAAPFRGPNGPGADALVARPSSEGVVWATGAR